MAESNASSEAIEIKAPDADTVVTVPCIIKFAYKGFVVKGSKWLATCNKCNKTLTENRGITSAFTK